MLDCFKAIYFPFLVQYSQYSSYLCLLYEGSGSAISLISSLLLILYFLLSIEKGVILSVFRFGFILIISLSSQSIFLV